MYVSAFAYTYNIYIYVHILLYGSIQDNKVQFPKP